LTPPRSWGTEEPGAAIGVRHPPQFCSALYTGPATHRRSRVAASLPGRHARWTLPACCPARGSHGKGMGEWLPARGGGREPAWKALLRPVPCRSMMADRPMTARRSRIPTPRDVAPRPIPAHRAWPTALPALLIIVAAPPMSRAYGGGGDNPMAQGGARQRSGGHARLSFRALQPKLYRVRHARHRGLRPRTPRVFRFLSHRQLGYPGLAATEDRATVEPVRAFRIKRGVLDLPDPRPVLAVLDVEAHPRLPLKDPRIGHQVPHPTGQSRGRPCRKSSNRNHLKDFIGTRRLTS